MPTILFCGDTHGRFDQVIEAVHRASPIAIFLLGDIEPSMPLDLELREIILSTRIYWIHGNHDTDTPDAYDLTFGSGLGQYNIDGRVVDVAGVRIAGLGGVFRGRVWDGKVAHFYSEDDYAKKCGKGNQWRGGAPVRHRSTIFPDRVKALSQLQADILITHEAPSAHPCGFEVLTQLANDMKVKQAFHGHHHQRIDYPDGVWHGVELHGIFEFKW